MQKNCLMLLVTNNDQNMLQLTVMYCVNFLSFVHYINLCTCVFYLMVDGRTKTCCRKVNQ